ncbi:UNVERIFIED_CONTAM: ATP-dependent 6-phosphofructokinase [Sesamum radiatum]|uniref:ATP-dependent 6-phosphofructokinase n=1 Tax=Sesamum radiatum TaxID=300843 RepID=A0AAW2MJ23_SESRA
MASMSNYQMKVITGDCGYVLQDVPHLTDYISNLPPIPIRCAPILHIQSSSEFNVHFSVLDMCFVHLSALSYYLFTMIKYSYVYCGFRQYFVDMDDSVPQKIVVHKDSQRGVHFRRAGPRQRVYFAPEEVHACIVTCGGLCPGLNTVIREIVHSLDYMYGATKVLGIDVYIIGGDGTQKGAAVIYEEIRKRGLKVVVAGIPKTIDNDIPVIDRSFGFDTAVEEAQRAINAAHVEAESAENGIGVVKLMGRYSGFIAMYATLASRDVDCCLIPESPFYLEGRKLFILIIGNKKLTQYIADPTYMIRAIPSNAADNVYCTLLAQSAVHGAMAGYTGFTSGLVNGRQTYIPFNRITESQNKVVITDRMWARLLSSTNQPSFLGPKEIDEFKKEQGPLTPLLDDARDSGKGTPGKTDTNKNGIKAK